MFDQCDHRPAPVIFFTVYLCATTSIWFNLSHQRSSDSPNLTLAPASLRSLSFLPILCFVFVVSAWRLYRHPIASTTRLQRPNVISL